MKKIKMLRRIAVYFTDREFKELNNKIPDGAKFSTLFRLVLLKHFKIRKDG